MLKYTLGALAAACILLAGGFAILSQVTGGGADDGRAPLIIVSASDIEVWPADFTVKQGQITELSLQNRSSAPKAAKLEGDGVEQLPELQTGDQPASRDPLPNIDMRASPGMADRVLVRFSQPGEYTLTIYTPGVYFTEHPVTVIVE